MTIKKDIENTLNHIIKKLDDSKLKSIFANYTKNMQFTFPDLNTSYVIIVKNGKVESLTENKIETPDIHITIKSGIFLDIINKKITPIKAYTTGKLKAKGKFSDILKLQKLL